KDLHRIREESDQLCQERGLSVIVKKDAPVRYTLAEKALLEKGKTSWKDEIRTKIEEAKQETTDYEAFKGYLFEKHEIEVRERGNTTTYYDHANKKRVRDNKLGADYEREVIKDGFERPIEGERTNDGEVRGYTGVSRGEQTGSTTPSDARTLDSERTGASDASESRRGLSIDRPAGGRSERDDVPTGNREPRSDQQGHRRSDAFDYEEFNRKLEQSKQGTRKAYQQHKRTTSGIDRNLLEPTHQEPTSPSRAAEEHTEYTPRPVEQQPQTDQRPTQANEREGQQQHHRATKPVETNSSRQHAEDRDRNEQSQEQARTTAKRNIKKSFEQDLER
ncbi:hypothetical protein A0126_19050, partial (plasmid) [Exiguobacterium sp. N4-1P]